jgi:hypothetical protein
VFFGFVNANQPGAGGRPIGSLGLDFDSEQSGGRLAVRLITAKNQSCGTFITPYVPGKFRPTSLRNDGTIYKWTLDYDPAGASARGQFTFMIASDAHKPGELESPDLPEKSLAEARARFPSTTKFVVDLPEGFKQHGTTFDHFGMMNMMKPGGRITIFFDDLKYLGRAQDFARDPNWISSGSRRTYQSADVSGAHDFGFSQTDHAGGKPGEVGGTFWRAEKPWGCYADKLTPLSFNDRLEARGKVILKSGGPDADMCFGWFSAGSDDVKEYLGIHVGGPTRIGHAFTPVFRVNEQLRGRAEAAPVMMPGKACDFSIIYDPAANNGDGAITAMLAGESVTHHLKPGQKAKATDARFDRFGVFTVTTGGQMVKLFLDDLQYTAGPSD